MSRNYISLETRRKVFSRANFTCEYCKSFAKYSSQPFVIDHVLPVSQEGNDDLENLACSCGGCNNHKYNKTEGIDPIDGSLVPIFNPRTNIWASHFTWNDNFTEIIGITSTSRATVETLKLNREALKNLTRLIH